MKTYNYDELLSRIQTLPRSEKFRLLEDLAAMLRQEEMLLSKQPLHSFLELEGLGQEIWEGVDAQKFIKEERDSWDRSEMHNRQVLNDKNVTSSNDSGMI